MKSYSANLTWSVLLICLIFLDRQTAANDDLDDFDFADINNVALLGEDEQHFDKNYRKSVAKGVVNSVVNAAVENTENLQNTNIIPLNEDWSFEDEEDNSAPGEAFNYREKLLRKALAKALSNVSLRQRFVEVMPILRVLNAQQRLALSALISAQMQKQHDQPLKLEEVRKMFGNDRKLLLPIMFDIANLVSSSAYKYLPVSEPSEAPYILERRTYELTPEEEEADNDYVGIASDMTDDMLDPQDINDQLQSTKQLRRKRRSAEGTQLVHKLVRAVPFSTRSEDELQSETESHMAHINMTGFEAPFQNSQRNFEPVTMSSKSDVEYQQVENMALDSLSDSSADEQITDLPVTIEPVVDETLPKPQAIISGHRYRLNANKVRLVRPKPIASRKRVQIQARPKSGPPAGGDGPPLIRKCERFTASMCIRTDDYPL